MQNSFDSEATDDEKEGVTWWNSLADQVRRQKLEYVQEITGASPTVAKAWEIEKKDRSKYNLHP